MTAKEFIDENYFSLTLDCKREIEEIYQALEDYAETKQLTIPVVVQQSEQLFCGVEGGFCPYEESDRKCRAEHKCINQVAK